jgi:hypothetical protein
MARRVNSEMLLVGSLPADSTEGALRAAGGVTVQEAESPTGLPRHA